MSRTSTAKLRVLLSIVESTDGHSYRDMLKLTQDLQVFDHSAYVRELFNALSSYIEHAPFKATIWRQKTVPRLKAVISRESEIDSDKAQLRAHH